MEAIHFSADQVARREHEELNPDRFDFQWNATFTECTAIPLRWWNESSYRRYQYDCGE